MINPTLQVTDEATPALRAIAAQLQRPVALYKDVGRRVANDLKKHYRKVDASQSNRLGGTRTHFWNDVRDGVQQPDTTESSVEIAIVHYAIRSKVYGGTITPKNARALTIPLIALAHGRRASVFEEETGHELFRPKGKNVLMAEISGQVVSVYALVRSVTVRPDPQALPPAAELMAGIMQTAEAHRDRVLARKNGGA